MAEIPATELLTITQGGDPKLQGTWCHPQIAIHAAQWISPQFSVQVTKWVYELALTGSVTLNKEKSQYELDSMWKDKCQQLEQKLITLEEHNDDSNIKCLIDKWQYINLEVFSKSNVVYIIYIGYLQVTSGTEEVFAHTFKFGRSENILVRLEQHKATFGEETSQLVFCHKVTSGLHIENKIKTYIKESGMDCKLELGDKVETELFMTTPKFSIINVVTQVTQFCAESTSYTELEQQLVLKDHQLVLKDSELKDSKIEILELKYKLLENGIK